MCWELFKQLQEFKLKHDQPFWPALHLPRKVKQLFAKNAELATPFTFRLLWTLWELPERLRHFSACVEIKIGGLTFLIGLGNYNISDAKFKLQSPTRDWGADPRAPYFQASSTYSKAAVVATEQVCTVSKQIVEE